MKNMTIEKGKNINNKKLKMLSLLFTVLGAETSHAMENADEPRHNFRAAVSSNASNKEKDQYIIDKGASFSLSVGLFSGLQCTGDTGTKTSIVKAKENSKENIGFVEKGNYINAAPSQRNSQYDYDLEKAIENSLKSSTNYNSNIDDVTLHVMELSIQTHRKEQEKREQVAIMSEIPNADLDMQKTIEKSMYVNKKIFF